MFYFSAFEQFTQAFRLFDRHRADEHRLAFFVTFGNVVSNSIKLLALSLIHHVGMVDARHAFVRRDNGNVEIINFLEFDRFGIGCTGHTGQLVVHAEVVLNGDRGQGLVFFANTHALFSLNRLMESV